MTSSDAPRTRRARTALLVGAPIVLAAAYALVERVVGDRPSLDAMVPDDAVLVWRFRDAAAYDALRTPPEEVGATYASASRALGAEINLPELAGIDRGRPMLEARLEPGRRVDPRFWVLPVADAKKVRATFTDPDLPERHAQRVDVHGDWAAASPDFYASQRAGHGSKTLPAARGETWMAWVPDWPAFVDAMLLPEEASAPPVAGVLEALGFDPHLARRREGTNGVEMEVPAGRVTVVRSGWSSVAVYGFEDRVRAELSPAAPDLVAALRVAGSGAGSAGGEVPGVRPGADAGLVVAGGPARRALALALGYAGVPWSPAAAKDGFAALHLDAKEPVETWAEMIPGAFPAWVIVSVAAPDALPDFAAFGLPAAAEGATTPLPAPPAITMPYGRVSLAAEIARRRIAGDATGREVVALGVRASEVATRVAGDPSTPAPHPAPGGKPSGAVLARFRLSASAAVRVLGGALGKGGLLSPLQGADIVGEITTDGATLVVEARRATSSG